MRTPRLLLGTFGLLMLLHCYGADGAESAPKKLNGKNTLVERAESAAAPAQATQPEPDWWVALRGILMIGLLFVGAIVVLWVICVLCFVVGPKLAKRGWFRIGQSSEESSGHSPDDTGRQ
jgi:hypothetical protein